MEFHQLRYFVEVARLGHFSRAAAACFVSQPSLSQQLRKLEDELGQPLIRRTRQGARLTDFGAQLLPRARRILQEAEQIAGDAQAGGLEAGGKVVLGAIPTIAPYLLPSLMESCLVAHPLMQLTLVEDTTADLVEKLRLGQIDFALMSRPYPQEEHLESRTLFEDELLITLPSAHPLKARRRITLPELADYPLVLMKDMHCLSQQSRALCEASKLDPQISIESAQLETVVALVEAGLGYSFIPRMAASVMAHRRVNFHPVSPRPVSRSVVLAWARDQSFSRTHAAFLEEVAAFGRQRAEL